MGTCLPSTALDGYHDGEMYALRPVEDGHGLLRQQGPHAIGPRHMAQQRAVRALVRVEEQGMWLACSAPSCAMTSVASGCVRTSACRVAGSVT